MKYISNAILIFTLLSTACSKTNISNEQSLSVNSEVINSSSKTSAEPQDIVFTQEDLFPEGVVYNKFNDRFYVSSTTRGDIGIVDDEGNYMPFITDPDLIGTTGLKIDEARKLLFVANATAGSVGIYKLSNGERVNFIDLRPLIPGAPVFINDIALDPQGNAYVTNSRTPVIYKISTNGTASIFYQDDAFTTSGFGFNGIEYGNQNGGFLLVAFSAGNQLVKLPIAAPSKYNIVSLNATLAGPDGLLLSKNGKDLIVVNNAGGNDGKVVSFTSNNKWQSGAATNTFQTGAVFPTTATTNGKSVFVLYAYLNRRNAGQSEFTIKQIPGSVKF